MREEVVQLERSVTQAERFSAMGFFAVDHTALLGIMSTVVTYLIILLQTQ
jgi:7tm Chemosensory receptor